MTKLQHSPNANTSPRNVARENAATENTRAGSSIYPLNWIPVALLPTLAIASTHDRPAWEFMWILAASIFVGLKFATWSFHRSSPIAKSFAYFALWPGLTPDEFVFRSGRKPATREWTFAATRFLLGVAVLTQAVQLTDQVSITIAGWLIMAGIILTLHFGVFDLLSCFWRSLGLDARPLMNSPWASTSVADFWGKRWNTAFRDVTHRFLFTPLRSSLGNRGAVVFGFFVSGLVHDLVISLPARDGFGGPTLYFLAQAAGLVLERNATVRRWVPRTSRRARAFTWIVIFSPLPLLFHESFAQEILLPFARLLSP